MFFCIARVKQKSCKKLLSHNDVHCIQDPEDIEKRLLPVDHEMLAIEYQKDGSKFQEEEEHGDCQPEENATVSHNIKNNGACSKRKYHDGVAGIPEIKYTNLFLNNGKSVFSIPEVPQKCDIHASYFILCKSTS
jgi:coilin